MTEMVEPDEDLVVRLRRDAAIVPDDVWWWFNPLLLEAADEIERLRQQIAAQAQS